MTTECFNYLPLRFNHIFLKPICSTLKKIYEAIHNVTFFGAMKTGLKDIWTAISFRYKSSTCLELNMFSPLQAKIPFIYPPKTLENLWFSDVFRGNIKGILAWGGLSRSWWILKLILWAPTPQHGQTYSKKVVGNSQLIVWVCLTILWGWHLKGWWSTYRAFISNMIDAIVNYCFQCWLKFPSFNLFNNVNKRKTVINVKLQENVFSILVPLIFL